MTEEQRPVWGRAASRQLDDWLAILPDGSILAYSGKVEVGTGVRTALAQIVAEELEVPLDMVHMVMGDTERTPDEGYTAGSMTIRTSGGLLRNAAAEARVALLERAVVRLGASATQQLDTRGGAIWVKEAPHQRVSFGELQGGLPFGRLISEPPLKPRSEYQLVGSSALRSDLTAKFTGGASFVHDMRIPGMLHARVIRSRSAGARVVGLDSSSVSGAQVVRLGNFVAVVAEREEQAVKAATQLQVEWEEPADLPVSDELSTWMINQPSTDQVVRESGSVDDSLATATKQVHSVYHQPFQAHASLGPSCAVAAYSDDKLTVWCSSGGVYPLQGALSDLLALPSSQIHVVHMEGSGAYGQNGSEDVAADAAVLAREIGRPVRVLWSRSDEFIGEPKAAAMRMEARAGLNEEGNIVAWDYQVWSSTHADRPRQALGLLAGGEIRGEMPPPSPFFVGGDRNAATTYTVPDQRVTMHWLARPPLRTSSMRSLGGAGNTFANESFMDELAAAAEADPLEFRLRHLDDPRAGTVLAAAAQAAEWGLPLPPGEGRGVAFARYENTEAYVAMVAHVALDQESGALQLRRIVVAHDCGLIINPDGVRNQIEGNVIQAASRALKEEISWDANGQTTLDWESYPILTFSQVPQIDVLLIDRPDQPSVGAGEPATVTVAAAIANAVYAAAGIRLRQVPFTPERVRAAFRSR